MRVDSPFQAMSITSLNLHAHPATANCHPNLETSEGQLREGKGTYMDWRCLRPHPLSNLIPDLTCLLPQTGFLVSATEVEQTQNLTLPSVSSPLALKSHLFQFSRSVLLPPVRHSWTPPLQDPPSSSPSCRPPGEALGRTGVSVTSPGCLPSSRKLFSTLLPRHKHLCCSQLGMHIRITWGGFTHCSPPSS